MILQLCSHIVHDVLNVVVSYIFIIASLFTFAQIVSFFMYGFYYAATSGVIKLTPSRKLHSYVTRWVVRPFKKGGDKVGTKKIVKIYNYRKDLVESE